MKSPEITGRHLVDPELLPLLDLWPAVTLNADLLPLVRAPGRLPLGAMPNLDAVTKREALAGAVPLLLYRPARAEGPLPCLYHIHGGGYVGGSAAALEPIHRLVVETLGCALVSVEYRLAPETPFPGALEDCHTGLDWLFAQADELGIDATRIGVVGESAGGGLAAALALMVRDRGVHRLAFQHLAYPMLDDRTCTRPQAAHVIWNAGSNAFAWQAYLGAAPGSDGISAYAAPARATDLAGLPPCFIATGALDLFVDENAVYATRLIRAGVATEFHIYPGAFHGFDVDQSAAVSRRMRRDSWDFLKRHLQA